MMHKPRIPHALATGCGLVAGVLAANPWQASTTLTLVGSGLLLLIAAGLFFRA